MVLLASLSLLWPVHGEVVRPFVAGDDPFARGLHRGIDIAAGPGRPAKAACSGRVRFAGVVPRHGRTVAQRCGRWSVTYVGLAAVSARRGRWLRAGERLGESGRIVHLGVRSANDRFGYVDPLALLPGPAPGVGPAPVAPVAPRLPGRPHGAPPGPVPGPAPPSAPPLAVWAGAALLGLSVPTLVLVRGRRQRSRRGAASGSPAIQAAPGVRGDQTTP